jgi:hypothetical protein
MTSLRRNKLVRKRTATEYELKDAIRRSQSEQSKRKGGKPRGFVLMLKGVFNGEAGDAGEDGD